MRDIVVVQDLWFKYPNGVTALKGVDLTINEDTTTALIGQNGSGKTTLAKMTNGLLKPTKGKVLIEGVDTAGRYTYELARHVGYSFQNPTHQLYTDSVEAELMAGPLNLGLTKEEAAARAEEAAKMFGLEQALHTRPSSLSFPLKKITGIASVFTMKPKVMVLDEPTTGQDHVGLRMIQGAIRKLRGMGITVVIITHDMRLVAESADRVVTMALGKIVRVGTPKEIFLDGETMEKAALRPPQILELSSRLDSEIADHGGPSRTVDEEVEKLRRIMGDHS
jgi:energy-coupling factor transport system ATP-binding protein